MNRDGDYDLSKPNALYRKKSDFDNRIILINNSYADIYISVHLNVYKNIKYSGPQVFYSTVNNNNFNLANIMQKELNNFSKTKRKVKIITNTYMYKKLNIKGVLIECGFLSNYQEKKKLLNSKYQTNLAQTITSGIIKYFNN